MIAFIDLATELKTKEAFLANVSSLLLSCLEGIVQEVI